MPVDSDQKLVVCLVGNHSNMGVYFFFMRAFIGLCSHCSTFCRVGGGGGGGGGGGSSGCCSSGCCSRLCFSVCLEGLRKRSGCLDRSNARLVRDAKSFDVGAHWRSKKFVRSDAFCLEALNVAFREIDRIFWKPINRARSAHHAFELLRLEVVPTPFCERLIRKCAPNSATAASILMQIFF